MKKDILLAKLFITELIQETIRPDAVKKSASPSELKKPQEISKFVKVTSLNSTPKRSKVCRFCT